MTTMSIAPMLVMDALEPIRLGDSYEVTCEPLANGTVLLHVTPFGFCVNCDRESTIFVASNGYSRCPDCAGKAA